MFPSSCGYPRTDRAPQRPSFARRAAAAAARWWASTTLAHGSTRPGARSEGPGPARTPAPQGVFGHGAGRARRAEQVGVGPERAVREPRQRRDPAQEQQRGRVHRARGVVVRQRRRLRRDKRAAPDGLPEHGGHAHARGVLLDRDRGQVAEGIAARRADAAQRVGSHRPAAAGAAVHEQHPVDGTRRDVPQRPGQQQRAGLPPAERAHLRPPVLLEEGSAIRLRPRRQRVRAGGGRLGRRGRRRAEVLQPEIGRGETVQRAAPQRAPIQPRERAERRQVRRIVQEAGLRPAGREQRPLPRARRAGIVVGAPGPREQALQALAGDGERAIDGGHRSAHTTSRQDARAGVGARPRRLAPLGRRSPSALSSPSSGAVPAAAGAAKGLATPRRRPARR